MLAGAAPGWAEALELTPNQIIGATRAMASVRGESQKPRRGTPEEFKAALMGLG